MSVCQLLSVCLFVCVCACVCQSLHVFLCVSIRLCLCVCVSVFACLCRSELFPLELFSLFVCFVVNMSTYTAPNPCAAHPPHSLLCKTLNMGVTPNLTFTHVLHTWSRSYTHFMNGPARGSHWELWFLTSPPH